MVEPVPVGSLLAADPTSLHPHPPAKFVAVHLCFLVPLTDRLCLLDVCNAPPDLPSDSFRLAN